MSCTAGQKQDIVEEVVGLGRRLQQGNDRRVVEKMRRVRQELDDRVRRAAVQARTDFVQEQHLRTGFLCVGERT